MSSQSDACELFGALPALATSPISFFFSHSFTKQTTCRCISARTQRHDVASIALRTQTNWRPVVGPTGCWGHSGTTPTPPNFRSVGQPQSLVGVRLHLFGLQTYSWLALVWSANIFLACTCLVCKHILGPQAAIKTIFEMATSQIQIKGLRHCPTLFCTHSVRTRKVLKWWPSRYFIFLMAKTQITTARGWSLASQAAASWCVHSLAALVGVFVCAPDQPNLSATVLPSFSIRLVWYLFCQGEHLVHAVTRDDWTPETSGAAAASR